MIKFLLAKTKGMITYNELELGASGILNNYLVSGSNVFVVNLFKKNKKWSAEYQEWISPRLHRIANCKNKLAQMLQIRSEIIGIGEEMNSSYLLLEDKIRDDDRRLSGLNADDRKVLSAILHPDKDFEYVIKNYSRIFAFSEPSLQCFIGVAKRFHKDTELEEDVTFYLQMHMLLLDEQFVSMARNGKSGGCLSEASSSAAQLLREVREKILQGSDIDLKRVKEIARSEIEKAKHLRDSALINWPISDESGNSIN
jgi:hypothetical protein